LQVKFDQLSHDHDAVLAERDRIRAMEALVQRESDDANRTVNMQEEQILEHRMALREADARYQEQQMVFDGVLTRLGKERDEIQATLDELRISGYDRKRTEYLVEEHRREHQTVRAQVAQEVREKEALERRIAELNLQRKEDLDVLRLKLNAQQQRAKREKAEKDQKVETLTDKVKEITENLQRQDRTVEDFRRLLEEERKRRTSPAAASAADGEELQAELDHWTQVAEEREAKCERLQSRLQACESALTDQKGELKDALSFLKAMRYGHAELLARDDVKSP
jgi:chromosome segregation ATPase